MIENIDKSTKNNLEGFWSHLLPLIDFDSIKMLCWTPNKNLKPQKVWMVNSYEIIVIFGFNLVYQGEFHERQRISRVYEETVRKRRRAAGSCLITETIVSVNF